MHYANGQDIKNKFRKALIVERHLIGKMVKEEKILESTSVKEGISEEINEVGNLLYVLLFL